MQNLANRLKDILAADTAYSHLLHFLLKLFRHWSGEVLVAVLNVVIGIMTSCGHFGVFLWIACILLALLLTGIGFCKAYDSRRKEEDHAEIGSLQRKCAELECQNAFYTKSTNALQVINSTASNAIYRVARDIKHDGWEKPLEDIRDIYGFQIMAFAVCKEIYNLLRDQYNLRNHWVTVYQCFENANPKKKNHCKMVAYANSSKQEPMSYQETYPIQTSKKKCDNLELHTKIFASTDTSARILMTQDEVQKEFKIHEKSRNREMRIQQYIGLPSNVCNRGIMFLLQVDCDVEGGFGKTRAEVERLVDDVLSQYVTALKLYYEMDRFSEVGTKHVSELNGIIEGMKKNGTEGQASRS